MKRFIALLLATACSSSQLSKVNDDFNKKYHDEVEKINEQRQPSKEEKKEVISIAPPTKEEVAEDLASRIEYYPYADIAQLGDAPRQENLPNRETYDLGRGANPTNRLPPNIFDLNYNLALHPPFRRLGAEFDSIDVPPSDAFGVPTNLSNKTYLLVGNNSLQPSIDLINAEKSSDDVEITKKLVAEKKEMQRQDKAKENELTPQDTNDKKASSTPSKISSDTKQNSIQSKVSDLIATAIKK